MYRVEICIIFLWILGGVLDSLPVPLSKLTTSFNHICAMSTPSRSLSPSNSLQDTGPHIQLSPKEHDTNSPTWPPAFESFAKNIHQNFCNNLPLLFHSNGLMSSLNKFIFYMRIIGFSCTQGLFQYSLIIKSVGAFLVSPIPLRIDWWVDSFAMLPCVPLVFITGTYPTLSLSLLPPQPVPMGDCSNLFNYSHIRSVGAIFFFFKFFPNKLFLKQLNTDFLLLDNCPPMIWLLSLCIQACAYVH